MGWGGAGGARVTPRAVPLLGGDVSAGARRAGVGKSWPRSSGRALRLHRFVYGGGGGGGACELRESKVFVRNTHRVRVRV